MHIAICDDTKMHLDGCSELIKRVAAKHHIEVDIKKFTSGENLLYGVKEDDGCFDAVFLDINMPKMSGTQLAERLNDEGFPVPVIFFTASKEHFLDAFDVGAFNYIVKDKDMVRRVEKVLLKLEQKVEEDNEDFIILVCCGEKVVVPVDKINYFESQARIMTVHYSDRSFEFYSRMKVLEEELYGKGFLRIHRSYLIAVNAVMNFNSQKVVLRDGTELPVGSTYSKNVLSVLRSVAGQ